MTAAAEIPIGVREDGTFLSLSVPDLLHHHLVVGPTGVGKTAWLLGVGLSALRAGVNLVALDPKGDLAGSLAALADLPANKAIGLGVVDPRTTTVETVDCVVEKVREALQYRDASHILLNPDCGFGTFADRPVNTEEIAAAKLRVIVEAAAMLRTA